MTPPVRRCVNLDAARAGFLGSGITRRLPAGPTLHRRECSRRIPHAERCSYQRHHGILHSRQSRKRRIPHGHGLGQQCDRHRVVENLGLARPNFLTTTFNVSAQTNHGGTMTSRPTMRSGQRASDGLRSCATPHWRLLPDFGVGPVTLLHQPFQSILETA
jgi:hypothetical protein